MGESSKPLNLPSGAFDWPFHAIYLRKIIETMFDDSRMPRGFSPAHIVADDWGAGPTLHLAAEHGDTHVLSLTHVAPIAFTGYPVNEIQDIGLLSLSWYAIVAEHKGDIVAALRSPEWARAVGPFAQTLVQIFKTMVAHPENVYNQYSLRTITRTYVDDDYERLAVYRRETDGTPAPFIGEDATSTSLRYNYHAIAMLAIASSRLAPAQLLPRTTTHPRGVRYSRIRAPVMILWGKSTKKLTTQIN